jgi:hypothetical protein
MLDNINANKLPKEARGPIKAEAEIQAGPEHDPKRNLQFGYILKRVAFGEQKPLNPRTSLRIYLDRPIN